MRLFRKKDREELQMRLLTDAEMAALPKYDYEQRELWAEMGDRHIYGMTYVPKISGKVPLVIMAHELGLTHRSFELYAHDLATHGVASYIFDFRGGSFGSRSDGTVDQMSLLTEAEDLRMIMECAKEWDLVDPDRVILLGGSQGAAAAAIEAAREREKISGLVLLFPAFLIPDEIRRMFPGREDIPETWNLNGWIRLGKKYADDVWDYDIYKEIGNYDRHVLLMHGDRDDVVPLSWSERAAACYSHVSWHVIHGAGHGFLGPFYKEAMRYIYSYLDSLGCFLH